MLSLQTLSLNSYLSKQMKGLTAKVFRTYNASITLQKELFSSNMKQIDENTTQKNKVLYYNKTNKNVALLCNHKKSTPKTHEKSMDRLREKMSEEKAKINKLEKKIKYIEKRGLVDKGRDKLGPKKKKTKVKEEDIFDDEPQPQEKTKKLPKTVERCEKMISSCKEKIIKIEVELEKREDGKTVALGTSKINYMDLRITVAWCKSVELPLEKIFTKTLRQKFSWAMDTSPSWRF